MCSRRTLKSKRKSRVRSHCSTVPFFSVGTFFFFAGRSVFVAAPVLSRHVVVVAIGDKGAKGKPPRLWQRRSKGGASKEISKRHDYVGHNYIGEKQGRRLQEIRKRIGDEKIAAATP